ncbi:hypothetical protein IF2G_04739 [Cordyceps javanica]|nr:hypothetical protein IF2G_04739 [Cordyceps javanica]
MVDSLGSQYMLRVIQQHQISVMPIKKIHWCTTWIHYGNCSCDGAVEPNPVSAGDPRTRENLQEAGWCILVLTGSQQCSNHQPQFGRYKGTASLAALAWSASMRDIFYRRRRGCHRPESHPPDACAQKHCCLLVLV